MDNLFICAGHFMCQNSQCVHRLPHLREHCCGSDLREFGPNRRSDLCDTQQCGQPIDTGMALFSCVPYRNRSSLDSLVKSSREVTSSRTRLGVSVYTEEEPDEIDDPFAEMPEIPAFEEEPPVYRTYVSTPTGEWGTISSTATPDPAWTYTTDVDWQEMLRRVRS